MPSSKSFEHALFKKGESMDSNISEVLSYLIGSSNANFSARLLASLRRVASKNIPAMAVALQSRHYVLLYNPDWVAEASYDKVVTVIEHEALHVLLEHVPRAITLSTMFTGDIEKYLFNDAHLLAADMADNCLLIKNNAYTQQHADEFVLPQHKPFEFPADLTYEQYVHLLMAYLRKNTVVIKLVAPGKDKEQGEGQGEGQGQSQEPGQEQGQSTCGKGKSKKEMSWGELQKELAENHKRWIIDASGLSLEEKLAIAQELHQEAKTKVAEVVDDIKKSRGTLPGYVQELVEVLLAEPTIPWTQVLRDLVVNTRRSKPRRSLRRPNRRHFGIPRLAKFPGKAKDPTFSVAFLIDTSGSMGTEELQDAIVNLQGLQKVDKDIHITIVEADVEIHKEYEIGSTDKVDPEFHGRGGTDFNAALLRAQEIEADIVFYYTDGYGPAPELESRVSVPFAWLITKRGTVPDEEWGRVISLDNSEGFNDR
jgi:predicted metal-dependent peptidase